MAALFHVQSRRDFFMGKDRESKELPVIAQTVELTGWMLGILEKCHGPIAMVWGRELKINFMT